MALLLAATALATGVAPAPVTAAEDHQAIGQLIARVGGEGHVSPTTDAAVAALLERAGVAVDAPLRAPGVFRLRVLPGRDPAASLSVLRASPLVVYAEPDAPIQLPALPARFASDSDAAGAWGLAAVGAPRAWPLVDGSAVTVAVLDTGVSPSHPELVGRVLPGWNFVAGNDDTRDDVGHGTYVAGIIAAARDGDGLTGVAPGARILPVKVLNRDGVGSTASFADGIRWAVDAGARVINISGGGVLDSQTLLDALSYAEQHGVVVVASAGNSGGFELPYPAAAPTVLGVAAMEPAGGVAGFSSFGPHVSLIAPGVDVLSAWSSPEAGDGYTVASGTSAATPFVAGAAALVAQAWPEASAARVRQILTETALDVAGAARDGRGGFGRVDAFHAARVARPLDAPAPAEVLWSERDGRWRLQLQASGFLPHEPVAVWAHDGIGWSVFRDVRASDRGDLWLDLGPSYRYAEGEVVVSAAGERSGHGAAGATRVIAAPVHPAFMPVPAQESTAERLYFAETGHTLAHGFKDYWEAHGGLPVFGYPISEEFTEVNPDTGLPVIVQYFERNRFEYHPELPPGSRVLLGRLGAQSLATPLPGLPASGARPGARYFPETGHTLGQPFLDYWEANGGLPMFGYPLSESFEEGGRLVQYFERARFEYHPGLPREHQVLLARLGVDLARQAGYLR